MAGIIGLEPILQASKACVLPDYTISQQLVEVEGIEPSSHGPKPRVLPLNYTSSM